MPDLGQTARLRHMRNDMRNDDDSAQAQVEAAMETSGDHEPRGHVCDGVPGGSVSWLVATALGDTRGPWLPSKHPCDRAP